MRTLAPQAASRANGVLSRGPKTTVVNNESRQGFQELVRQHMPCTAPRKTIHLECLTHARGALAGAPSPASGPCARSARKGFAQTTPVGHALAEASSAPAGGAHCAPEP